MPLRCVVHYKNIKLENSDIIPLKDITYSQFCKAKEAREALGGAYLHQEQCDLIPQDLDGTHHGYHRQCYKKFTNAVSVAKRKSSSSGEQPPESKRPRRSGEFSGKLFPDKCMICGSSGTKKVKSERQKLKIISTEPACKKIKLAANLRKDD